MIQETINELITVAVGLAILGGAYLVWLLSGIANVLFTEGRTWSWKRMFEDLVKTLLMCVALLSWVVVFNVLDWFAIKMGADISAILDGASVTGLVGGIIGGTVYFIGKGYKNFYEFINTSHTEVSLKEGEQDYTAIAEKIYEIFDTPTEVVEAQKEFEKQKETEDGNALDGGLGVYYNVPHDNYDNFRNAVNGRGYDVDNAYGYQCYDGACLLWMQIGRWLSTGGTGAARGCWTAAKTENAGNDFELIYNKADVKRGDVVVFNCGSYGHIGFADEDYNGGASIRLLGQNQGGTSNPSGGAAFNVINMSMATFLGAFRFKAWKATPAPTPTPTPTPAPTPSNVVEYTYKKGDTFGQVICDLGLKTSHGLWGADGDVAYYTAQLNQQGIYGNIPIGTTIKLTRRTN